METMTYHLKFTRSLLLKMGDMKNKKAYNILVQQMVCAGTEKQKGFSVIADYTDVFVLLCFIICLRHLDNLLKLLCIDGS